MSHREIITCLGIAFPIVAIILLGLFIATWLKTNEQQQQIDLQQQQIAEQQKQTDQLCSSVYIMLCNSDPNLGNCRFADLQASTYLMRLADYRDNSAIFDPFVHNPEKSGKHYILVYDIPLDL